MLKLLSLLALFTTNIVFASMIFVRTPDPQVRNQLQSFIQENGGNVAGSPLSAYTINVNPLQGPATMGNGGAYRLSFHLAVSFTKDNQIVDNFVIPVSDLSSPTVLNAMSPFSDRIANWVQMAVTKPDHDVDALNQNSPPAFDNPSGKLPTNFSPPSPPVSEIMAPSVSTSYTGVILDTTGFKVSRGMSPKIYDETGRLIYGLVSDANVDRAMEIGVVGYANSYDKAISNPRVGAHPLILHIVNNNANPGNFFPKDVVLSKHDADILLNADKVSHFLDDYKVVFIVDPRNL